VQERRGLVYWGTTMRKASALALALYLLVQVSAAHAWWNDDWAFRKQINLNTIASGMQTTETHVQVPVLVRLHLGNFQYFADVLPDGRDIRFVASDDLTPLKYHIEKFDAASQIGLLWVQLPQLTAGLQTEFIYMYYGNPEAVPASAPAQTFDKNHAAVLHFAESDGVFRDSTAYGNHPRGTGVTVDPAGRIGSAARFDGTGSLRLPNSPSLIFLPDKGWTFSSWLRLDRPQQEATVLSLAETGGAELQLTVDSDRPAIEYLADPEEGEPRRVNAAGTLAVGTWHHIGLSLSNAEAELFIDGPSAARLSIPSTQINGSVVLGSDSKGAHPLVDVKLDEARVSNVARSAQWLSIGARSQGMDAFLLAFGEDSQRDESGTESHFVTTLRNVDWGGLEGFVIGICVVMALFSWYVMFAKGLIVARIRRANADFGEEFAGNATLDDVWQQLSGQDSPSTLKAIFDLGMAEIDKRVHRGSAGAASAKFLSPESMEAIRATLTARNVRISQSLNSLMVLLTLAIAGGPFLGLLGTVVGVMVTFAGIAASGDVNINAIAPGIAAALVATVAGLFVAIPALFGYNYITSRIKEVITENNVFLEEFMASAGETYQA